MAILQVLGADKAIRINHYNLIGLAQNLDWQPNFNPTDVHELGNTAKLATEKELEVTGSFEINASGALPGILARMAVKRNASTGAFEGFIYDSGGAGGKNAYTFTEADLGEMIFTLLEHERTDQKHFNRSVVLPRMFLTGVSCRLDANGSGRTTINFAGDYVYVARSLSGVGGDAYHDQRSVFATYVSTSSAQTYDTSMTGYTAVYLYVNEKRFTTTNTDPTYFSMSAAGVITITTTEGFALAATDVIVVLMYKTVGGTLFQSLSTGERSTTAYFMKGYQASAYIAPANIASVLSSEQWLRAQTIDWNVDLRVEALRQIAYNKLGTSVYARVPTNPFDITLNATCTETDLAEWQSIMSQTFDGTSFYNDNLNWAPLNQKETFAIVVKYFTTTGTLLSEWRFSDMSVIGAAKRVAVGGRGETQYSFRGSAFSLIGSNG